MAAGVAARVDDHRSKEDAMTDPDGSLGERVAIVETDIKHIVSGIARIEDGMVRIQDELGGRITEMRAEFKADIGDLRTELKAEMVGLRTELKEDFQRSIDIMETAMTHNKTALYAVCGTVIAAVAAALVKGSFF